MCTDITSEWPVLKSPSRLFVHSKLDHLDSFTRMTIGGKVLRIF